jgi:hypothetical protein
MVHPKIMCEFMGVEIWPATVAKKGRTMFTTSHLGMPWATRHFVGHKKNYVLI